MPSAVLGPTLGVSINRRKTLRSSSVAKPKRSRMSSRTCVCTCNVTREGSGAPGPERVGVPRGTWTSYPTPPTSTVHVVSSCATTVPTSRPIKRHRSTGVEDSRASAIPPWCEEPARDSATWVRVLTLFWVLAAIGCGGSSSETPPPLEPDPQRLAESKDEAEGRSKPEAPPEEVAPAATPGAPAGGSPPVEDGAEFGIDNAAAPPPPGFVAPPAAPEAVPPVEAPAGASPPPAPPPVAPASPPATDGASPRAPTWGAPPSNPPVRAGKPKKAPPPP
ncbi:MAG: hypothetical protein RL033_7130 [Pseudomonadota bacterium]|jgi:hypothetical protein